MAAPSGPQSKIYLAVPSSLEARPPGCILNPRRLAGGIDDLFGIEIDEN